MKINKIKIMILAMIIISTNIIAQSNTYFTVGEYLYVTSSDGLNMLEEPKLESKKITALLNESKIQIIEIGKEIQNIQGKKSRWILTMFNGQTGWVYGGYLSKESSNKNFRYYLSKGRADTYSISIGMKNSEVINIFGEPDQTVGFMGRKVNIYKKPFLNIHGETNIQQITWGKKSSGKVFGLIAEETSEEELELLLGTPNDIIIIEPDMDGEAINVGKNYIYREPGYYLQININEGGFVDYFFLSEDK